jgi:hypothetical protein
MNLTRRNHRAYAAPALEKNSAGIAVLSEAAMSRKASAERLFYACASSNGRPGGRGRKARRCFSGTATPVSVAHPIAVGSAVTHRNWSKTMCEKPTIDRETASRINPLISGLWTEDTLDTAAAVVYELGYIVTSTELAIENLYHVFGAVAAALAWERENIHSVVQARKESGHV